MIPGGRSMTTETLEGLAMLAGLVAVGALMYGSLLLVRDTRRAVAVLTERAAGLRFRAAQGEKREG